MNMDVTTQYYVLTTVKHTKSPHLTDTYLSFVTLLRRLAPTFALLVVY